MFGSELIVEARSFEKKLLNFFWRHGVSIDGVQDLLQEVYLRLWKYRHKYTKSAKLSTFLFILARQVLIDFKRREQRRGLREEEFSMDKPQCVSQPIMVGDDVRWALLRLSEKKREVIELAVYQDLPYSQISEILGIPVGTVKSRVSTALKELKEIFNERGS